MDHENEKFESRTACNPGVTRFARKEIRALELKLAEHFSALQLIVTTDREVGHTVLMRDSVLEMLKRHPHVAHNLVEQLRFFADTLEKELPPKPADYDSQEDDDAEIPGISDSN